MKRFSEEKGITLVALVITIIILLILAGVTIGLTIGNNGILSQATTAKEKQTIATYQELITLEVGAEKIYLTDSSKTFLENVKAGVEKQKEFEGSTYEIKSNSRLIITTKEGYVFIVKDDGEVKFVGDKEDLGNLPTIEPNDIEFSYPGEWTNQSVDVTISSSKYPTYDIEYSYDALNWMEYTGPVEVTENKTIHARLTNGIVSTNIYGTENIINIDKKLPSITTALVANNVTTKGFTLSVSVQDTDTPEINASGISEVIFYYKLSTANIWNEAIVNHRTRPGSIAGPREVINSAKIITDLPSGVYQAYIEVYDVAGSKVTSDTVDIPLGEIGELGSIVYNPAGWTNGAVEVTLPTESGLTTKYTLDGTVPNKDTGTTYTGPITVTENKTINYIYTDGINVKGKTETVSNIDTVDPVIKSEIAEKDKNTTEITTKITVQDSLSGLGKIIWYYKASTETNWRTPIEEVYTPLNESTTGEITAEEKAHNFTGLTPGVTYQFYAEVYDVAGNIVASKSASSPLEITTEKILVTEVTLDKTTATITKAGNTQLTATVRPDDASDKNIKWRSSNTGIATVSTETTESGTTITVRGVAEGTVEIIAEAADGSGRSASCTVTVVGTPKKPNISVTSGTAGNNGWYRSNVTVIIEANAADVGRVDKITYTLTGAQTQTEIAGTSVNITSEGTTTITAWVYDIYGQKSDSQTFTVNKDTVPPSLDGLNYISGSCIGLLSGITATDATSKVAGSITSSPASLVVGTQEYTYTVYDNAGNVTTGKRSIKYSKPVCFVAGTKVSTPNGLVNIENLKVGDKVYTYNEETKETEEKEILNTFVSETNKLSTIIFENGVELKNTDAHPYYVVGKGWTSTKDLEVGDEVLTQNQTTCKITKIENNNVKSTKVYNLYVKDNHNYFVGENNLLVHNAYVTLGVVTCGC